MKKILLMVAGLAALASCSEKTFTETITSTFEVPESVNKANMAAQGNVIIVQASPDVSWTASANSSDTWVTLLQSEGTGSGEMVYSLTENTGTDARSAEITFQCTGDNGTFSKTSTITQIGTAPVILISPEGETTIPSAATDSYAIQITSNVDWSIDVVTSDGGNWITVADPASKTGSGEYAALFSLDENIGEAPRTATITISADDFQGLSRQLVITQLQKGVTYTIAFTGFTGIAEGEATMAVTPGTPATLSGEITVEEGSTVFTFSDMLTEGTTYQISSITPSGGTAIPIDCQFMVGAGGLVTWVEHYDVALARFGGNSAARPLTINEEADLIKLRDAVNGNGTDGSGNNYAGLYIAQTADIALTAANWLPIGNSANKFAGIYSGEDHQISGLAINSAESNQALFGAIGGVDATSVATVKNLTVRGAVTSTSGANFAGVVGAATDYSLIDNCVNHAVITAATTAEDAMGGIIGTLNGNNITISNCRNYANLSNTVGVCGGIAGNVPAAVTNNKISKCYNFGNIAVSGTGISGGIVGRVTGGGVHTIEMSGNHGNITLSVASTRGTAGVVGVLNGPADESNGRTTVSQCYNLGNHTAVNNLGGVVGLCNTVASNYAQVLNCYNKGSLSFGTRSAVNSAGVVGNATTNLIIRILNCYNVGTAANGTAASGDKFGGIVAANTNTIGPDAFTGVSGCFYLSGIGYTGGVGGGNSILLPGDATGKAEGKEAAFFSSAIPGWDTAIWDFTGAYPSLKNNPEQTNP